MKWSTTEGQIISLSDGHVRVEHPRQTPPVEVYTMLEAFERPGRLYIQDPDVCAELLQAIAHALPDTIDSPRRAFWRALTPGEPRSWVFTERGRHEEALCTLSLQGAVLRRTCARWHDAEQLLDDAFFHGPQALGLDATTRRELRHHVERLTGGVVGADQGFPDVAYGALERRAWDFDVRSDGRSSVIVEGASVLAGYFYGRDQGSSTYPVERVITQAPDVRLGAPEEMESEILAYVRGAVLA